MQSRDQLVVRYLSEGDIAALEIAPGKMADAIGRAFEARAAGNVQIPPKVILRQPDGADFYAMTVSVSNSMSGVKWVAGNMPASSAASPPSFVGLIILSETVTGRPRAILSAASITADRTAATSLLAARHLARADAQTIGLVGSGAQARAHLRAFAAEYPLSRALLYGRGETNLAATEQLARDLGLETERCDQVETLLPRSDILISSVTPRSGMPPILDASLLPGGAFASMVDHGASWLPEATKVLDGLHTDDLAATLDRSAVEPHLQEMSIDADFSSIGGRFRRTSEEERLGFVFAGTALADLAVCEAILDAAQRSDVGVMLAL